MSCGLAALLTLCALAWSGLARAETQFVIRARGTGFTDTTPVTPEGGNMATTLGERRKAVFEHAAELWAARIDTPVPIVLDVVFSKLGCSENSAALAGANAVSLFSGMDAPGADPALWYPSPLANRLAGKDLAPDEADIKVIVNTSIDDECKSRFNGFYYGFDGKGRERADLVEILLHELGHGLGFSSFVALDSGMPEESGVDVFTAHIFDLSLKKSWRELTNEQRRTSALNVRGLSFSGASTTLAAKDTLAKGTPSLRLEPGLAGYTGAVGDTGDMTFADAEGPVRLAGSLDSCVSSSANLSGALLLIRPNCMGPGQLGPRLIAAGVAGALIVLPSDYAEPAISTSIWGAMPGIPSLVVSGPDAELMRQALSMGSLRARMHWDATRLAGADEAGRPLLFASRPADDGSSVSHFEPLARPDLLMEPFSSDTVHHEFDLTWPVLLDLGWTPLCGNQKVDLGEECDNGDANSDTAPDACRKRCNRARCGDGVIDMGEACDRGKMNSDSAADTCRTSCMLPRCGDAVIDMGEACDQGANNDDARPNACRKDCRAARCGDGVVDDGEQCDGAPGCSASCALPPVVVEPMQVDSGAPRTEGRDPDDRVWRDPWDAPSEGEKHKKGHGCALAFAHDQTTRLGLLFLASALFLRRRRAREARA